MSENNFYITTPIYYLNDKPHLGHAYTTIACDVMARFKRLDGYDVLFSTGTDEHGQKVDKAAKAVGKDSKTFVNEIVKYFTDMCDDLKISEHVFTRTTSKDHEKAAQDIWKKMEANGDIYLDKYAGWYSTRDEAFYTEDEITTMPDGSKISTDTKTELEWVEEESYFFRLSNYTDRLLKLYEEMPELTMPSFRKNEVVGFLKQGLRDLSISRTSFDWGVPVPDNNKHVMYVWVDALTNYLTAAGYPDVSSDKFKKFWPCDVHVIGKDILRFHSVYWPAFLISAGIELPKQIYAHGWWLIEGEKMSKSLGNVVSPKDLIDSYGLEPLRYALLREVTFGNDGDFSRESIVARINAELANNIGNLVQRSLSMINKNCEGKVPKQGELLTIDKELLNKACNEMLPEVRTEIENMQFSKAMEVFVKLAHDANIYIDEQAPWKLKKENPARMASVLYVLAEVIRNLALVIQPFTPDAANKILDQLMVGKDERDFSFIGEKYSLKSGTEIPKPQGVFPRILDSEEA